MDRYAFLADLVTAAANCVPNAPGCEYDVFVGIGIPPQECSYISASWVGTQMRHDSAKCRMMMVETFEIVLNRCCMKNTGESFDSALEDEDAQCFIRDFGALVECMACSIDDVLLLYVRTAQEVSFKSARLDPTSDGFCYGGTIAVSFERVQPCPPC
jgi:hypothetical protein